MDNEVSYAILLTRNIYTALRPATCTRNDPPITSDEKWFYGLVARTFAKACESLGINKQTFSYQHKSHITKVMSHGTVGYCFDGDPEQGGNGYLIGLHRCQSYKVMQRKFNEQMLDAETGKHSSKGNAVKYNRGDLVLTDCNVTGSNYGTATKPKFSLKELWTTFLLPALEALVRLGGPCEEACVFHQEDTQVPISTKPTRHGYKANLIAVVGSSNTKILRVHTLTCWTYKCSQL
jgi:hypothetical protein